jgi:rubredoxin
MEMSEKEKRIRAITRLYYSRPDVQKAMLEFSLNREIVPRYFEGFGKRPDGLQYASDIMGLVQKGATSFHASEEIWNDPLQINSDMGAQELNKMRKSWDLLIDIDSPFLDCSKIACKLIINALEHHGIKNYGIKFSGSKGFHIIVSGSAFPKEYAGKLMEESFPEWPRTISEYLMDYIRADYNRLAADVLSNFEAIERRTNVTKEELTETLCKNCGAVALKGLKVKFKCPVCNMEIERKNFKETKRRLKCIDAKCPGVLEIADRIEYHYCGNCKDPEYENMPLASDKHPERFEKIQGVSAQKVASLDLVLVASRHLFRMPYSLHEKTALVSAVLNKEEIENFDMKDANPLSVKIKNYLPKNEPEEAYRLLSSALEWKKNISAKKEKLEQGRYKSADFQPVDFAGVRDEMFPKPIKKLLQGLKDGKKRGLFILLTFLKTIEFKPEEIIKRIQEWNKLNEPPLKEGYVKSQIDWHLKQKKKIMPPNYDNDAFYKDLGLLDKKPEVKNPIVEVMKELRRGV